MRVFSFITKLRPILNIHTISVSKIKASFSKLDKRLRFSIIGLTIFGLGVLVFVLFFTFRKPFVNADIFPFSNKAMTAGTIVIPAQQNKTTFTLNIDGKSGLTMKDNISFIPQANAQTTNGPTANYETDGSTITAEVTDPTGQLAKNIKLTIAQAGDELAMNVEKVNENEFVPGVYKIEATLEKNDEKKTITQNFAWGVLAINSLKSVYTPGETAKLHFGVLDELGNTLCNAKLTLEITKPDGLKSTLHSGKEIITSEKCNGNTYSEEPDYATEYFVETIGEYDLKLTAVTNNGKFTVTDKLIVQKTVPFVVERTKYPTRIFPGSPYETEITIKASQDFDGGIIETIPASFQIIPSTEEGAIKPEPLKTNDNNAHKLLWPVNLKKGDEITLNYSIIFPDISPEFYLVGPLEFNLAYAPGGFFTEHKIQPPVKSGENIVFRESRQWQIASDAVVVTGGITTDEAQFGGLQRKVVYVNSNWYAFYNDGTDVSYKKSANGTTWSDPAVDMDGTDADNFNPSVDVSGNTIQVFWVDDSLEKLEGRTIDTASSDSLGVLCSTPSLGTLGSNFMTSVAALTTTSAVVAGSDTINDTEFDVFEITGLNTTCTVADRGPGNITLGIGSSSYSRPVLVGLSSTRVGLVSQDGNLTYSEYDVTEDEWVLSDMTIASVTDNVYSVVTNEAASPTVWVLSDAAADTTDTNFYTMQNTGLGSSVDFAETTIDSAASGTADQDALHDIDMSCISATDCKMVYVDNMATSTPDIVFVDCNDASCSIGVGTSAGVTTMDADCGTTSSQCNPAIDCSSGTDCKIVYFEVATQPDIWVVDCDGANDSNACGSIGVGTTAFVNSDTDFGSSSSTTHLDIDCISGTDCKYIYDDDDTGKIWIVDCADDECSTAGDTLSSSPIDYGASVVGPKLALDCPTATTCKIVGHDIDAGTVLLVDCSTASNPSICHNPPAADTIGSSVGTTADQVAVDIDCAGNTADCKIIYTNDTNDDLIYVDCNDTDCDTPDTTTTIDSNGGASATTEPGVALDCFDAGGGVTNNCKFLYTGAITDNAEKLYMVDCDNVSCTAGSVVETLGPRFRSDIECPTSADCKMVYYAGTNAVAPGVYFADCDNEKCHPTVTDSADPWTSETNVTSVSLTYDSSNSDLIANVIKDSSETLYSSTADATTISWGSSRAYDDFSAAGDMDNVSTPETAAGTTPMGALVRQGANMEFDLYATVILTPALVQNYYRFRDDTTALNTDGGWLAAINTRLDTVVSGTVYRLRVELADTSSTATNYDYQLEYAQKLGSSCPTGTTYRRVPATSTDEAFETVASSQYAQGAAITSSRLTATGSFVNGIAVEDPSYSTGNHTLNNGEYSEFEYAITVGNGAVAGGTYCFRLTNAGTATYFTQSAFPEVTVAGPVVYWKLDEGTVNTCSGGANDACNTSLGGVDLDGLANNTPTIQADNFCVAGKCYWFDGTNNENLSVSDNSKLDFGTSDSFTVAAWTKRNGVSSAINYIVSKADTTTGGYKLWMDATGEYCFGIDDDTAWGPDVSSCSSGQNFDNDQWHHVAGVRNVTTDTIYLYVDGKLYDSDNDPTSIIANGNTFYVGVDRDGTSNEWLGFLDEIKISREALSADQIKAEFIARGSILGVSAQLGDTDINRKLSTGLVGYWQMNEGVGNTGPSWLALDSSGNSNTGTGVGNAGISSSAPGGKFGNGGSFDGNSDVVTTANSVSISPTSELTVSGWVRMDSAFSSASDNHVGLVDKGDYQFYLDKSDGKAKWVVNDATAAAFSSLSTGISTSSVKALAVYNGNLYIGGNFTDVGDANGDRIVKWNGSAFSSLSTGIGTGTVYALAVYNGNLYIGGDFTNVGDVNGDEIVMWNGSAFSSLSTGISTGTVYALAVYNGNLYIGGSFTNVGDANGDRIVAWNGSAFSSLSTGISSNAVNALAVYNGNLYIGGTFLDVGGANGDQIVMWNGSAFSSLSTGVNSTVSALAVYNGNLYIGGSFANVGDANGDLVVKWGTSATKSVSSSTSSWTAGTWYHLAATHTSTGMKLYVNGVLEGSATGVPATLGSQSKSLLFGQTYGSQMAGGSEEGLVGRLDDVRVYNRALAPQEVTQLYNWAPGPVGHWKMDENTGTSTTVDSSGNGLNGTITNGVWSAGQYGSALSFDGSGDYVTVSDNANIDFGANQDFTVSAWVKTSMSAGAGVYPFIVSKEYDAGASRQGYEMLVSSNGTNTWFFSIYVSGTNYFVAGNAINDGKWHHLLGVRSGSTIYAYEDGRLINSASASAASLSRAVPLRFSASSEVTPTIGYVNGLIDDVKIYNYARTPGQIVEDMNAGHPAPGSPVGSAENHWKFDEGVGNIANNAGILGTARYGSLGAGFGSSAPSWTNSGKFGKALSFDGADDFVSIATTSPNSQGTIVAWIKLNSTSSTYSLVTAGDQAGTTRYFHFRVGGTALAIAQNDAGTEDFLTAGQALSANIWYHVALTSDNTQYKMYINGVNQALTVQTGSNTGDWFDSVTGADNLMIGVLKRTVPAYPMNGFIDEVKIYSFPLTADQIKVDYNQGKALVLGATSTGIGGSAPDNSAAREYCPPGDTSLTCSPPLGEWLMNEGIGSSALDSSGNGYHASFGTGSSAPTRTTSGKYESGLSFGTYDYAETSMANNAITGSFTMGGWVYFDSEINYHGIMGDFTDCAGSPATAYDFCMGAGTGGAIWAQVTNTAGSVTSQASINESYANEWMNLTMTWNATTNTVSLYKNGILRATDTDTLTLSTKMPFRMGAKASNGGQRSFLGKLDHVRLYNYLRTPAQIAWEYNRGKPIAWYKLDEGIGSSAYNSTVTGNNIAAGYNGTLGTGASAPTWTTGKRNGALDFDGTDDYFSILATAPLNFGQSDPFSVSAWIKPDTIGAKGIINKQENVTNELAISLEMNSSGNIVFQTSKQNVLVDSATSSQALTAGSWYHVAGVYDITSSYIYINGIQDGTNTINITDASRSVANVQIGRIYDSSGYFDGIIDDVRFYTYPLTAEQVKIHMQGGAVNYR